MPHPTIYREWSLPDRLTCVPFLLLLSLYLSALVTHSPPNSNKTSSSSSSFSGSPPVYTLYPLAETLADLLQHYNETWLSTLFLLTSPHQSVPRLSHPSFAASGNPDDPLFAGGLVPLVAEAGNRVVDAVVGLSSGGMGNELTGLWDGEVGDALGEVERLGWVVEMLGRGLLGREVRRAGGVVGVLFRGCDDGEGRRKERPEDLREVLLLESGRGKIPTGNPSRKRGEKASHGRERQQQPRGKWDANTKTRRQKAVWAVNVTLRTVFAEAGEWGEEEGWWDVPGMDDRAGFDKLLRDCARCPDRQRLEALQGALGRLAGALRVLADGLARFEALAGAWLDGEASASGFVKRRILSPGRRLLFPSWVRPVVEWREEWDRRQGLVARAAAGREAVRVSALFVQAAKDKVRIAERRAEDTRRRWESVRDELKGIVDSGGRKTVVGDDGKGRAIVQEVLTVVDDPCVLAERIHEVRGRARAFEDAVYSYLDRWRVEWFF